MQLDQHTHVDGRSDPASREEPFGVAAAIGRLLGDKLPIAVCAYDGSCIGAADSDTMLVVRSSNALRYALTALTALTAPGELGIARAYVRLGPGRSCDRTSLRRLERLLPHRARAFDDVLLRRLAGG